MKRVTSPLVIVFLLTSVWAHAQEGEPSDPSADVKPEQGESTFPEKFEEKWNSGWSVYLDNDLMIGQDEEYTGGFAVNLSGRRAAEWPWSLDPVLGLINDVTGVSNLGKASESLTTHSMEIGMTAFTPDDIEESDPLPNQHPYAGLVFLNNVREKILPSQGTSYKSVLSVGVLGTSIPEEAQKIIHDLTGSTDPEGWDNQISDGGEPTARYTLIRQDLLYKNRDPETIDVELKSSFGGSLGYVSQLQGGFNFRLGRLTTPSWSFNPDFAEYVNMGTPVSRETESEPFPHELFLWGGIHGRLRGYNAMLEGQFRDSEVTFDRGELNKGIGEASLGVTCGLQTGTRLSIGVRGRTPELDEDESDERLFWGTIMFSQAY